MQVESVLAPGLQFTALLGQADTYGTDGQPRWCGWMRSATVSRSYACRRAALFDGTGRRT
ncbi:hypothetical protein NKH18_03885 [Streptomyces sp. M10(2022)]